MSERMGLTEFFAMEAGEYLERLDALVSPHDPPSAGEVVRITRALRGSALMAKQHAIAGTTAALENLARSIDEGRRPWDAQIKQLMVRTVDDLKTFVRGIGAWSEADDAKAQTLAEELDAAAGRSSASHRQPVDHQLDAGTRAFIGREGAAVASALDHAAKSLQQNPLAHDPLQRALTLMQPLRGLASLSELSPLPDILDGVEQAVGELSRNDDPLPEAALLFHSAAKALSRAAQEAATIGTPDPDAPEASDFATRLGHVLGLDVDVVPIESLFHDDNGPHIVKEGTKPNRPAELGRLEMVSHGEHLQQAANDLEEAGSATLRSLRAQALAGTFRALSSTGGSELGDAVARFANAAGDALGRGAVGTQTDEFVAGLRSAADVLTGTQSGGDESKLADDMLGVVTVFQGMRGTSGEIEAPETTHAPYTRPAAESVAASQARTTPAPTETDSGEALDALDALPETNDLSGSWARYQRYVDTYGPGEPSLDELVAGPPADPVSAPAASPVPYVTPEASITVADSVVDVTELEYAGESAVARARQLRDKIHTQLRSDPPDTDILDSLVEELTDLVALVRPDDN